MNIGEVSRKASLIRENVEKVIVGKSQVIELCVTCLLASGHVLLEDFPGTGKTTLAKSLAKSIGAEFQRVQFTPDLLPADLIGLNYYNPKTGEFLFRKGPLFTNLLLADEINRATPKTQSSLLESMEEMQITTDGETRRLTPPYFVIATQNPIETHGTFPLPEAQLDRFLMRLSMGYPGTKESGDMISRFLSGNPLLELNPVASLQELTDMCAAVSTVFVHEDIIAYGVELAERTRRHETTLLGVSPRGALSLIRAARAKAAVEGREYVIPEDVKSLCPYVFAHRIIVKTGSRSREAMVNSIIDEALSGTPVPMENWRLKAGKED